MNSNSVRNLLHAMNHRFVLKKPKIAANFMCCLSKEYYIFSTLLYSNNKRNTFDTSIRSLEKWLEDVIYEV